MGRPRKIASPFENDTVSETASPLDSAVLSIPQETGPVHDGSEFSTADAPASRVRAFAGPEAIDTSEEPTGSTTDLTAPSPEFSGAPRRRRWGDRAARLGGEQRKGYVRRWVLDLNDRVEQMRERGYTVVNNAMTGKPKTVTAGRHPDGGRLVQVLMEIPEQFAKEDFEDKQKALNATDNAIMNGTLNQESDDRRYIPRGTPMNVRVEVGGGR